MQITFSREPVEVRIKVVHVITRLDKGGSAENTVLTLAGLDRARYELILVKGPSTESHMSDPEAAAVEKSLNNLRSLHVRLITIPTLVRRAAPLKDSLALAALIRLFRKERPQIVHTHTSKAGILGRWAARLSGCPHIVHTPHGHIFWGYFDRFTTFIFILLERLTARFTDCIITLTDQEKKDHRLMGIAPEEAFRTIHSGVDLNVFSKTFVNPDDMKRELGIPEEAFVIGTIGRLTPVKGQRYLVEAAREIIAAYPNTEFVILGHGELLSELRERASALGIEKNILFPGWRPDAADVLTVFDIFVLPSLNEGMGKAIVEAMASGKPIVASRIGGIPDLIRDGQNGILVPPADAGALARAVIRLRKDGQMRARIARAGKRDAADFGTAKMIEKIDLLYRDLVMGRKSGKRI